MKNFLVVALSIFLFTHNLFSQKKKNKNNEQGVQSTSALERIGDYKKRLALEKNSIAKNIFFRNIGPTVMSGRVVDFAVNPDDPTHFYVAYASGGLWETKNHGNTFSSIFDKLLNILCRK